MVDDDDDVKRRAQGRSPPFPFINLEKAMKRAEELLDYSKGHPVRSVSAVTAWGYQPKSSGGIQTIGALKGFGLLSDSGSNEDRKVQITELGKRLLRNPPPSVKRELLREAALNPKLFSQFWSEWGSHRPPDSDCRWELVDQRGFTDEAATKFLATYDSTISYAGLLGSDRIQDDAEADGPPHLEPAEEGGMDKPAEQNQRPMRFAGGSFPAAADVVPPGMRKAVFPVSEGDVTLIFPTSLSPEGLEELGDYLEIFLRKAKREIEKGQPPLNG